MAQRAGEMKARRDEVVEAVIAAEAELQAVFDRLLAHREELQGQLRKHRKAASQHQADLAAASSALAHAARHAHRVLESSPQHTHLGTVAQLGRQLDACERLLAQPLPAADVVFNHSQDGLAVLLASMRVLAPSYPSSAAMEWDGNRSHPQRLDAIQGHTIRVVGHEDFFYVLGNITISPSNKPRFHFALRIDALVDTFDLKVGVVAAELHAAEMNGAYGPKQGWVWCAHGNRPYADTAALEPFARVPRVGSLLRVEVDGEGGRVAFFVDGEVAGSIAFPKRDVVPAVALYYRGSQVTLESSGWT